VVVSVDPIELQIGARLRALRESKGMSRPDLGRLIGVSAHEIADFECGEQSPSVSTIVRLAEALGGSAADLIGEAQPGWTEALAGLARGGAEGSLELVSAFSSIQDGRQRRAFLEFAWTLVEAETRGRC
jgi:transcriptional regulator with XRE-family HTH domain